MTLKALYQKLTNSFGNNSKPLTPVNGNGVPEDETPAVDFQGSIDIVSIEGIFQLFYLTNLTGELTLSNHPQKATFHFSKGLLTWGTLHTEQKQIGRRLINSELITEEQLTECLSIQGEQKDEKRIGEILLQKGFLQSDMLHESLKKQAKEAFFSVLNWTSGTFSFISNVTSEKDEVSISERIDHLLLEGAVHIDKFSDGQATSNSEESTLNFFRVEQSEQ